METKKIYTALKETKDLYGVLEFAEKHPSDVHPALHKYAKILLNKMDARFQRIIDIWRRNPQYCLWEETLCATSYYVWSIIP